MGREHKRKGVESPIRQLGRVVGILDGLAPQLFISSCSATIVIPASSSNPVISESPIDLVVCGR